MFCCTSQSSYGTYYDQFKNFFKKSIGVIVIFFKIIIQVFGSLV
jgi:hypothetical protein